MSSNYFKEPPVSVNNYDARILDLSASGLLFAHSSKVLSKNLVLYSDLDLSLKLPEHAIKIGSRVMRKYQQGDFTCFGVQFMQIEPEDFKHLFLFIYGREYTEDDEFRWEGGAEPPELDIFD